MAEDLSASFSLASFPPFSLSWKLVVWVFFAALAVLAAKLAVLVKEFFKNKRVLEPIPEAPGGLPVLGHVLELLKLDAPWNLMQKWMYDFDPIVKFRIMNRFGVILREPAAIKRIFQTHMKSYPKDVDFSYTPFLSILGTGLVTSSGQLWQRQRLLMAPALRVEILDDVVRVSKRAVDRLIEKLEKFRGTGTPVDMSEEFRLLTLQVIGQAILSLPPEECDKVFPQLYLPVMEECNTRVLKRWRMYLPQPDWFKQHYRMYLLNNYIKQLLRSRWQNRQNGHKDHEGDILDRIMSSLQEQGEKWSSKLEDQLCFEIKTFLLAGHETSAAMLTWALYELTQNKDCMQKVREEAGRAFVDQTEVAKSAVDNMLYTLSTLKESLRKYTVVPVVCRYVGVEQDELCGYKIPKGTLVVCGLQGVHNLYKDPSVFSPERFMPGGEYDQFDESIRPFMFVPFIQGPRNCLGQHFSLLESRVVLSMLVKKFSFRPASSAPPLRSDIIPEAPQGGLQMYID